MDSTRNLEPPWTLSELATACSVSRSYLWKCVRAGSLAIHRRGKVIRVAAPEARRFARSLGAVPAEEERHTGHTGDSVPPVKRALAQRATAAYRRKR